MRTGDMGVEEQREGMGRGDMGAEEQKEGIKEMGI